MMFKIRATTIKGKTYYEEFESWGEVQEWVNDGPEDDGDVWDKVKLEQITTTDYHLGEHGLFEFDRVR